MWIVADTLFVKGIHIGLIQLLFFLVKFPLRLELVGVVSGFAHVKGGFCRLLRSMSCLNTNILIFRFPDIPMYFLGKQSAGSFLYFVGQFRGWLRCIALKLQPCFLLYLFHSVSRFLRFLNGLLQFGGYPFFLGEVETGSITLPAHASPHWAWWS